MTFSEQVTQESVVSNFISDGNKIKYYYISKRQNLCIKFAFENSVKKTEM